MVSAGQPHSPPVDDPHHALHGRYRPHHHGDGAAPLPAALEDHHAVLAWTLNRFGPMHEQVAEDDVLDDFPMQVLAPGLCSVGRSEEEPTAG